MHLAIETKMFNLAAIDDFSENYKAKSEYELMILLPLCLLGFMTSASFLSLDSCQSAFGRDLSIRNDISAVYICYRTAASWTTPAGWGRGVWVSDWLQALQGMTLKPILLSQVSFGVVLVEDHIKTNLVFFSLSTQFRKGRSVEEIFMQEH